MECSIVFVAPVIYVQQDNVSGLVGSESCSPDQRCCRQLQPGPLLYDCRSPWWVNIYTTKRPPMLDERMNVHLEWVTGLTLITAQLL
jgi:hypothetical protein